MGVSLEVYRSRIGLYRHRCPRQFKKIKEKMVQLKMSAPDQHWRNMRSSLLVLYICMFYAVMIFEVYYSERSTMPETQSPLTVLPAEGNIDASQVHDWECFRSREVWQSSTVPTAQGLGNLCRQITITGLFRLLSSGDVEENPGPPKHATELVPVYDLKVTHTTHTAATVTWKNPETMNAVKKLRFSSGSFVSDYEIHFVIFTSQNVIHFETTLSKETCQRKVEDLLPDRKYTCAVTIRARGLQSRPKSVGFETGVVPVEDFTCEGGYKTITVSWKKCTISRLKLELDKDDGHNFAPFVSHDCATAAYKTSYTFKSLPPATNFRVNMVTYRMSTISRGRKEKKSVSVSKPCTTGLRAPQKFEVSYVDKTKISMKWNPGLQHSEYRGRTLTHMLRWRETGSEANTDQWTCPPTESAECTGEVTGLKPGTKYDIEVCSKMSGVQSSWVPLAQSVLTKYGPIELKQVAVTDDSVTVSWKELAGCPGFIVGYWIDLEKEGKIYPTEELVEGTNTYKITGLKPASYYKISVRPQLQPDNKEDDNEIISICTYPAAPVIASAKVTNGTTLDLTLKEFEPNQSKPHGYYRVRCLPTNDPLGNGFNDETFSGTRVIIDSLAENTEYRVSVWHVFHTKYGRDISSVHDTTTIKTGVKVGERETWSEAKEEHTIALLPAPSSLNITEGNENSLTLSWASNYDVDRFIIQYRPEADLNVIERITSGTELSIVLENIQAATTYLISVSAERNGIRSDSVEDSFSTRPNKVTELKAKGEVDTIQVRWTDIYAMNNYKVKIFSKDVFVHEAPIPTSAKELTITEAIRPGTVYEVSVYAVYKTSQSEPTTTHCSTRPIMRPSGLSTSSTDTTITARLNAPVDRTGIKGYELKCMDTYQPKEVYKKEVSSDANQAIFCNLTAETTYRISVSSVSHHHNTKGDPLLSTPLTKLVKTGLKVVEGLTAIPSATSIVAQWKPVKGHRSLRGLGWRKEGPELTVSITDPKSPQNHIHPPEILEPGSTQKTFTDLQPETDYVITVTPLHSPTADQSSAITKTTKSTEKSLVVTDRNPTSISVRWEALSEDDTRYSPTIEPVDQVFNHAIDTVVNDTTCIFKGLEPGTAYKVTLSLGNVIFTFTKPAPPKDVELILSSDESLTIKWAPPNGQVDSYRVCLDQTPVTCGIGDFEYPFLNLTPGRLYTVTLESCSNEEFSIPSSKHKRIPPCKPMLRVSNTTEDSITVKWHSVNGQKEKYILQLYTNGKTFRTHEICDTEQICHEHIFTDLTPARNYKISAVTQIDNVPSKTFELDAKTIVPSPENLDIYEVGEDYITVNWTTVVGDITGYLLRIEAVAYDDEPLERHCDANTTRYKLTPLISGRKYHISVFALSGSDRSTPRSTKQYTRVRPPGNLEVGPDTDFIRMNWTPPDGDVEWYDIAIADTFGNCVLKTIEGNISSYTVTDDKLTPGTLYNVTLESRCGESRSGQPLMKQVTTTPVAPLLEVSRHDIGHDHVTVYWSEARGNVDRYMVSLHPSNHGIRPVSKDSERKCTFYGLTPGKGYTIKICSEINDNIQSYPIEQRIFTRPLPPARIDIKESDITETSMKVEWKSPPKGEVMKWYLQISSNTGTALSEHRIVVIQAQPSQHLYRYTFYGLRPGRLYDVGILAESGGQCSEEKKISRRTNVDKPKIILHKHAVRLKHITVECEPLDGDSDSCEVMVALSTNPTVYVNGVTNRKTKNHWKHCFDALEPGTEYKISATAKSGRKRSESFNTVVRTCVDAPSNLRIDEQADGAIIRWSAAKGYVDGYNVTLSSGKEIPMERFVPASEDPNLNFPHLVPGRMYKVSVSSIIKQDEDEVATSTTVSSEFRAKTQMPKVAIDKIDINSLKISWHDVTGERDRYHVSIFPSDSRKSETDIAAPIINKKEKLTHVFENLTPGKMYTVSVVTITGEDESERDSIQQRTRPDKPRLRKGDSVVNERQYFLEWEHSKGVFDKYNLTLTPAVDEMKELCSQGILETKGNSMIVDLVRGIKYCVSLWAVSGEENSLIETTTITVLPDQPLDVNATSTDTTITVTWKEPEGVKTGYVLKLFTRNSRTTKEVKNIKHGEQLKTCFEKCTRGREYDLTICTVAGTEQSPTDSHQVQTAVSKPLLKVEHTELSSIELSWSEVYGDKTGYCLSIYEGDGQYIASKEIDSKSEGWFQIWSNSYQHKFDGLDPGRRYEIRAFTRSGDGKSACTSVFVQTEVSPVQNIQVEPSQSETGFAVKWDSVVGHVDYYIVALETSSGTPIDKAEVTGTTHTFDTFDLIPGTRYNIRVKSVSGDKSSTEEIVSRIVRPCKAEDVSVLPNGPRSLKVSWEEAKGRKTHYVVTISPIIRGSNSQAIVDTGQPLVCEYSGLTSGREYTVTVTTVSEGVEGYAVKVSQTTNVSAPCNVFVKERMEENLTVSWTPGEGHADMYHVRAVLVGSSDFGTTSQIAAPVNNTDEVVCSISALQPGTCYDIYVKAESNGRCSHESHTQAYTLIGRVTEVHVSDETIESFKVNWVEARGQKTHYVLYVDPSNEVIVVQGQDKNLDYEFTGMQPGLEYKVVIHTGNQTEKSEPTELHAWTKPMPPKYVEITNVEQDSLTVRWCGPEDGGYDKFKVSIRPPDDEAVEVEGEITEHMFRGLIAGRTYEISVSTVFHCLESTPQTVKRMTDIRPPTLEIQPNGISQEHITLSVLNHKCDCDEYKIMVEPEETGDGYLKTVRRETDEDVQVIEHLVPGRKYKISAVSVTQNQTSAVESISARTTPAKVVDMRTEVTGRTCTITWDEAPGDKDGYYIQRLSKRTNAGSKREPIFVKSGQTPLKCTIRYLTPGRIYDVSVRTASPSDEGTRTMSEPICRQVQTSVSKAVIECSGHTDTSVTVKWLDVDGDKTSYKLWIIPSDGDNTIRDVPIMTIQSRTHKSINRETFTGLQPGRKYKIFCQTVSGNKESEESVIEVQTTVCPPQDVKVLTSLEHSLSVTWSHAKGDKDSYKLSLLLDKAEVASDTVPAPAEETHDLLSYTFQNLSAGFEYELEISTLSGKQYSVVKRYPAQTRPSPPQHVTIVKHGVEGLRVTWDEAEGKMSYYGVSISPSDGWKRQQVKSNPEKSYEWTYGRLIPGRKYTVSVTTVSGVAESEPVVKEEVTVVAEPKDVKIEHREETRLTLSWNPAKGDKIGYFACIEPIVSDHSSNELLPTNCIENKEGPMSCTFDDLQPGRQYAMTLKTKSCDLYSEEVTLKARTLVSPPKTLQVSDITTDNITLTWSEADGDKDYYQIKISPADGLNPDGNVKKDEDRLYTFSGLTAGKSYVVSIRTYSGGEYSHDKNISERTIPNAPEFENIVANIVDKGIQVAWQPVKGELDSYLLHLKPSKNTNENRDEKWHSVDKCDTSHIFPDLTFGRLYVITVETVSGIKNSSPVPILQRLTIDPPKDLKETRREERRIVVAWEAAIGDKDCYRVQLSDCNGLVKVGETTKTTWSSDELEPGTLYVINVQTACEGETSDVATIEVRTVACSPTSVYVEDVTEETISVTWPDADGNKDKYSVQIYDEEGIEVYKDELAPTILEKTFKRLVPGRMYQICIQSLCGEDDLSTSAPIWQHQRTKVAQPGTISMKNIELGRIFFSWEKSVGDVDHYTVDVSSSDPGENIPKLDPVGRDRWLESNADGLTAGRLYTISVKAVSGGDVSEPRTIRIRTKVDKPRETHIAAVGENTLMVTWDQATGDKDRYMLAIEPKHATCTPVEANDDLVQIFTNLVPGTFYKISITTVKSGYCSEVSSCNGWTRPLPPSRTRLSNILEKRITVSWDHVPEGGYEKYRVSIDPADADERLLSAENQECVFDGLTPGREYTVGVVAICGDCPSRRKISKIRTTVNTPNLIIESQNVTKNCIPVRWTRSEGDCDKYKLTIYTEKDETETKSVPIFIPNGSRFEHTFDPLVPGREYTVSLVAISGRGHSKPSRRVQRTIVAELASFNLSSTEDCIHVEWEKADGDASGYLVTLTSSVPSDEEKKKFIGSDETLKTSFNQLVPGRIYIVTIHTVVRPIRGADVFSSPVSHQKRTDVKPPKLKVDMVTKTSIRVKWPDVVGDRDEYRLHLSPTDQTPVRLVVAAEKSSQDKEYTFDGLVHGKLYEITAFTISGGQDSKAETINVRTLVCPPKNSRPGSTRTCTAISVQWEEPDGEYDGFYLRLFDPFDVQQSKISKDKGELCHSFANLVSGRKYTITIETMNEGERSESVEIHIQTEVADPEGLVVVPDGDGKLRASWEHCAGDKRGYLMMISPNDTISGPTRFIKHNSPLEHNFSGLVPGRMYSITLCAVSYGEQSKGKNKEVRATVASPHNVCIDAKTERSMSVSWYGSQGEVDGYLVSISDESVTLQQVCIKHRGAGVLMGYTFQELTPGRMYKVSVTAIREDDSSLTISPPASRTVVSQPNGVKIVEESVDSILVSWLEANGCKDRYHIEILDAYGPHYQEVEEVALQRGEREANDIPSYRYVFKNLTAGKRYRIRVLAESGNDTSKWTTTFGRTIPLPPEGIEIVTKQDTDIEIRWKPGNGEYDQHNFFLYSERVPEGVVSDSEVSDRATNSHSETNIPVTDSEDRESALIHKQWACVMRDQETVHIFRGLEHGRMYMIRITTKSEDKESDPEEVKIRTTVDTPKDLRETYHDETCIAVEWNHARGVKDKYLVQVASSNFIINSEYIAADDRLECTFDGLYPGRLYAVSVQACCGESSSKPIERYMRTTAIPPQKISIDEVKERMITVTWPEAWCDKDHYRVTLIPEGDGGQGEIQDREVSCDIQRKYSFRNLVPGQLYNIFIRTLSGRKESESRPIDIQRRTLVAKANNLKVSDVDYKSFTVEWEQADGVQNGYRINLNHNGQQQRSKYVDASDAVPFNVVFDNLTEGRLYTIHVITISGEETATAEISQRTKVCPPSKVQVIRQNTVPSSQEDVTVSWSRPSGDLSGYQLDIFDCKNNVQLDKSVCTKHIRYTFQGLVAGRKYRIDSRTISGEKDSDLCSIYERTVPRPPDDVQIPEQDVSLNSLKVTWKPPRDSDEECYLLSIHNTKGLEKQEVEIPKELNKNGTLSSKRSTSNVDLCDTLEHIFKNLTAGTEYRLSVLSVSAKGSTSMPNGERKSIQIEKQQMTLVAKPILHIDEKDPDQIQKKALLLTWIPGEGKTDAYCIRISPFDRSKSAKTLLVDEVESFCTNSTCIHRDEDQRPDDRLSTGADAERHYHHKVDDLGCLTEYEVTMAARSYKEKRNADGTPKFEQSNEKAHWITFTKPDPPQRERIYCGNESFDSFMLYWQPPRDPESRRTTHNYKIRYQNISKDMPATDLYSQGNTHVKIENTVTNAKYRIEIASITKVTNHDKIESEIESEFVEMTYRTQSRMKKFARYVAAGLIQVSVIAIVFANFSTFFGIYCGNCNCFGTDDSNSRSVDEYPTIATNSTPTAGTETLAPSTQSCLFEKAWTPFLSFVAMLFIWVIVTVFTIVCLVFLYKLKVRVKTFKSDEEARVEGVQRTFVKAREIPSDFSIEEIDNTIGDTLEEDSSEITQLLPGNG